MTEFSASAYRCKVQPGATQAVLKIRGSKLDVCVLELSRDEYVVEANELQLELYNSGRRMTLSYMGDVWDVKCESIEHSMDGRHRVVLKRMRDRTAMPKLERAPFFGRSRTSLTSDPLLPAAIIVGFLAACICLPGVGDSLGTAPKVKNAIVQFCKSWQK